MLNRIKYILFGFLLAWCGYAQAGLTVPVYNGQPYFQAYNSSNATPAVGSPVKLSINTKNFDSGGYYDNVTNYRFQPLLAGKYYVHGHLSVQSTLSAAGGAQSYAMLYKNGSLFVSTRLDTYYATSGSYIVAADTSAIVQFNGTTDYIELWGECGMGSSCTILGGTVPMNDFFEAYYLGP
jgi:hypothetical protein